MKVIFVDPSTTTEANVKPLFVDLGMEYVRLPALTQALFKSVLTKTDKVALIIVHGSPTADELREFIQNGANNVGISIVRIGISASSPRLAVADGFDGGVASFDWLGAAGLGLKDLGSALAAETATSKNWDADRFLTSIQEYFKAKYFADDLIAAYLLSTCLDEIDCKFEFRKFGLHSYLALLPTSKMREKLEDLIAPPTK